MLWQALALTATEAVVRYGVTTLYLSAGISVGTNGNLLARSVRVPAGDADGPRLTPR